MAAIYMWPVDEQMLLTTTLYPVEVVDSLTITTAYVNGYMGPLPQSEASVNFGGLDGSLVQTRWFYSDGPYDSDATLDFEGLDGTLIQTRWFYTDGPYDSDASMNFEGLDGSVRNKLVIADTPDEELQFGIAISATCSMELI